MWNEYLWLGLQRCSLNRSSEQHTRAQATDLVRSRGQPEHIAVMPNEERITRNCHQASKTSSESWRRQLLARRRTTAETTSQQQDMPSKGTTSMQAACR